MSTVTEVTVCDICDMDNGPLYYDKYDGVYVCQECKKTLVAPKSSPKKKGRDGED